MIAITLYNCDDTCVVITLFICDNNYIVHLYNLIILITLYTFDESYYMKTFFNINLYTWFNVVFELL